jgi:hypothetical protein
MELVRRLAAIGGRGACTDAERRAAVLVRDELRTRGRPAHVEPAWVRPQWHALYALLCGAGVAGTLLAISVPEAGLAVLAAVLVLLAGDASGRLPLARALLPRRATQCVVSEPAIVPRQARVRLIVTASLDAGRTGTVHRLAPVDAAVRRALGGHLPSPVGLLVGVVAALTALAAARVAGVHGAWVGAVALAPTLVLLVGAFALLDIAVSPVSVGAKAHASAVATALDVVAELDRDPPRHLAVELVLAGAGEAGQLGMRAYVRARRRGSRPEEIAVLALGPCGAGTLRAHRTEGLLAPARLHPGLLAVAEASGAPLARRQRSGALAARLAGWPALGVSCADDVDRPERVDEQALARARELCLEIVRRLDGQLSR